MNISVKKRSISIIAIIAFFIRVMLPFLATYSVASASEVSGSLDNKILICTANGLKWISLDDLENEENSPSRHLPNNCFLCQLAKNNIKDITKLEHFVQLDHFFQLIYSDSFIEFDPNLINPPLKFTYPSRAPPISI